MRPRRTRRARNGADADDRRPGAGLRVAVRVGARGGRRDVRGGGDRAPDGWRGWRGRGFGRRARRRREPGAGASRG